MGNGVVKQSGSSRRRSFAEAYILHEELGAGAFSVVKRGTSAKSGDQVAIKIISRKKLSDDDLLALKTEIEILGSLNHPHIIKLYETFDEGNEIYIVTEIVKGGELFDRIVQKTNYTEKEARDLIRILFETLAYMADCGVVHRDLKPENLLLCSDDDDTNVKIADFGFAKLVADLKGNETPCGTPGYVAPEVLRGDKYGCEVDVWSMGVICYVLLAGYPPFYDEDQKRLFRKIKEGRYHFHEEYWSNTSPEAIDMIKKMICVNQKNRWSARQLLSHPWMLQSDHALAQKNLTESLVTLKKFNARRRFKAAIETVMFTQRLKKTFSASPLAPDCSSDNLTISHPNDFLKLTPPGDSGMIMASDEDLIGRAKHQSKQYQKTLIQESIDEERGSSLKNTTTHTTTNSHKKDNNDNLTTTPAIATDSAKKVDQTITTSSKTGDITKSEVSNKDIHINEGSIKKDNQSHQLKTSEQTSNGHLDTNTNISSTATITTSATTPTNNTEYLTKNMEDSPVESTSISIPEVIVNGT